MRPCRTLTRLSPRTQGSYVAAIRQLAEHFHTSPAQLTEEQLREYFLYLANEKRVARTTGHDRVVRDPVPVRADAAPALADAPLRAARAVDAVTLNP